MAAVTNDFAHYTFNEQARWWWKFLPEGAGRKALRIVMGHMQSCDALHQQTHSAITDTQTAITDTKAAVVRVETKIDEIKETLRPFETMKTDLMVVVRARRTVSSVIWGVTKVAGVIAGGIGLVAASIGSWPFLHWVLLAFAGPIMKHLGN